MTPEDEAAFKEDEILVLQELANGKVIAVHRQVFTTALLLITDNYKTKAVDRYWDGWERRFCYETQVEAIVAGISWDGTGEPEGNWVKEKSPGVDRLNPKLFNKGESIGDNTQLRTSAHGKGKGEGTDSEN